MEQNLSMVIDQTRPLGMGISAHVKVHYRFCTFFLQTHQEILHLKEVFHNMYLEFVHTKSLA